MYPMIKIGEHFYITNNDTIKDVRDYYQRWIIEKQCILNRLPDYLTDLSECKLITHSTHPLMDVIHIKISDIEELVYGYNVEKLADMEEYNQYQNSDDFGVSGVYSGVDFNIGYQMGFRAGASTNNDKLFSMDELETHLTNFVNDFTHFKYRGNYTDIVNQFVSSVKSQKYNTLTKWDVNIDENNKITLA
jgi:hypothetical protein